MKKRISIHDVAKQLGVSSSTISFVLNGKADEMRISPAMKNKILAYVKTVGYQVNMVAKSLRTGKSKIIGMLVEDISDPFFSSIARNIEIKVHKLGYKIFFSSTENNLERAKALIKIYRDRQVDGYIIAPTPGMETDIQELLNDNCPVVLFDRYFPQLETHNIIVDNFGGAYQAVQHLIANNFRNIGLVTLDSDQTQMVNRLLGYVEAIQENQLKTYIQKIPYNLDVTTIKKYVKDYISQNPELDAILFATNYLAIAGLFAIHELGLSIPKNLGVIGFDDNTHFALFSPAVSAIAQPVQEISDQVINKLIQLMEPAKEQIAPTTNILPVNLIIRDSTIKPSVKLKIPRTAKTTS